MSQIFIPVGGGADLDIITAGAGDVLAGKVTVDREGESVIGIIPVRGGGTITPGTGNKLAVAAGQYVNDNIIVAGSSNLIPQNIKKGVNIFGVTGIWSGYVTGPEDFYNNGNNPGNFAGHHDGLLKFEAGMMQVSGSPAFTNGHNGIGAQNGKNISGYSRMCMDCLTQQASIVAFGVAPAFNSDRQYARATFTKGKNERSTVSLDISNINAVGYPWCAHKNGYLLVYRIWME